MSLKLLAAVLAALSLTAFVAVSSAETPTEAPAAPAAAAEPMAAPAPAQAAAPCRVTRWRKYRRAVRRTWRFSHRNGDFRAGPRPSQRAQKRLGRLRRECSPPARREAKMLGHVRERRAAWRYHRSIDRITPYGAWAIPPVIVDCESDFDWTAKNPTSPARGPYQLLGHGEPWPASTPESRARHHVIAAQLYASGGTGPWTASRHCWG